MKILKLAFIATSLLIMASCQNPGTNISGNIDGNVDTLLVAQLKPTGIEVLDTLILDNGNFSYTLDSDTADFYLLTTEDQFRVPLFVSPGEQIEINVTGENELREYSLTGSPESARIQKIQDIVKNAMKAVDTLNTMNAQIQNDSDMVNAKARLDKQFETIVSEAQTEMKALIDESPSSITNLFVFPQSIGNIQLISPDKDMAYYEKVGSALQEAHPENKHVKFYNERLGKIREQVALNAQREAVKAALTPGNEVPDIELPNPNGKNMKLSDLRGKVVLVDFWAAWCRPCRMENPNLVRMYNTYKGDGFDVFSVSLDGLPQQPDPKKNWIDAIAQDGLVWENHVSDLLGWKSIAVQKFGFQGIPFTVLVDRDGKIIATELRGALLDAKLKEVLGKS